MLIALQRSPEYLMSSYHVFISIPQVVCKQTLWSEASGKELTDGR